MELVDSESSSEDHGAGIEVNATPFPFGAAGTTLPQSPPAGRHTALARPAGGGRSPSVQDDASLALALQDAESVRADLRELEVVLLNLWVEVIALQPAFAEHLRAAARFTRNAVMALDASASPWTDDVIDLTGLEDP